MPESDYPPNWKEISLQIRERANWQCECTGECGLHRGRRCEEKDNTKAKWAEGKVVLTVAHRNHSKADCRPENLMALCNTCHLRYDHVLHMTNQHNERRQRQASVDMFQDNEIRT